MDCDNEIVWFEMEDPPGVYTLVGGKKELPEGVDLHDVSGTGGIRMLQYYSKGTTSALRSIHFNLEENTSKIYAAPAIVDNRLLAYTITTTMTTGRARTYYYGKNGPFPTTPL